ncbi:MAG: hypothetical protein ACJ75R_07065 [Solirubrobacterales bacterium]
MAATEEQPDSSTGTDRLGNVMEPVERETRVFQRGPGLALFGGVVPVRTMIALGVFVFAFVVVWMAFWAIAGGLGLALGWIPAALVGVLAVLLLGRWAWSPEPSTTGPRS